MDRDEANILFRRLREALYGGRGIKDATMQQPHRSDNLHLAEAEDVRPDWQERKMALHRDATSDNEG